LRRTAQIASEDAIADAVARTGSVAFAPFGGPERGGVNAADSSALGRERTD
jgi:hypothetical protein